MTASLILALDVATTTGFAHGPAGGHIISGSFRAGAPGASNAEVGRAYGAWLKDMLIAVHPRAVYVEAPNFQFMAGRTNATTIERLLGLMMLTDMAASTVGIYTVPRVKTNDFRLTFLGMSPPRKEAKRMMVRQCQLLGHEVKDDNAADAVGIHYHVSADILARARA